MRYDGLRQRIPASAALVVLTFFIPACSRDATDATAPEQASSPALTPIAALGQRIFKDPSLSASGQMSCATCHQPDHAHAGKTGDKVELGGPALDQPGMRNAPSIRYASFTPAFHFDEEGNPVGGLYRDGRAKDLADQARNPFLDAREMANPTVESLVGRVAGASYATEFRRVFGDEVFADPARAFDDVVASLAAYESESRDFHPFDSQYDAWLAGTARLTDEEERGRRLFDDPKKGNCAACHPSERGADGSPPLFTDFTYDNLGLPREQSIVMNQDAAFFDLGLCGPKRQDLAARREFCGAFKVPTLRNVARTAPYFHNGGFATLREVVDFYLRRDTNPEDWYPRVAGRVAKFNDLAPELRTNVNVDEVPYDRKPGEEPALSPSEIDDVVAFLKTLDDGYQP